MPPFLALIVAGGLLALAGGCVQDAAPASQPEGLITVSVSTPVEREVVDYEDSTGRTEAVDSVDVRARVTGYLVDTPFKEGAEVSQGAVLFRIDAKPYEAQVARDVGQLELAQANLNLAKADLTRARQLAQTKGVISQQDLDKYAAQAEVAAAQVATAQANLQYSKLNVDYCTVRAAVAGRVGRILKTTGNLVNADMTLLTTIVSMDPIYAYFDVDERTMLHVQKLIREGKVRSARENDDIQIMMELANEEGFPHQGTISFVNNRVDRTTGTLQVRATFPNPMVGKSRVLSPGLFVRVRMPIGEPHQALLINERTVGVDQGQRFVYLVNAEDTVEYRTVTLGVKHAGLRVVESGLKPGERIVVRGLQKVRPGMKVEARLIDMPTAERTTRDEG